MAEEPLEFKKIREFGEIINDIFLFIKQNFKAIFKVFVSLCGVFIIGAMVSGIIQQMNMKDILLQGTEPSVMFGKFVNINYFLYALFSLTSYTAINVSILSFIAVYIQKGNVAPTVEEVWARFKRHFFKLFGSSLLISIFYVFCFVLLIIPAIYVTPAMLIFFPVMVYEKASFSYSFNRSFQLLKDQWWPTFGVILIIYIITYASISLASLPGTMYALISTFT